MKTTMTRLTSELHRLYQPLTGADGRARAMVLTVGKPADWEAVSAVWQAVQAELSLPAPAIAVSGQEDYQLWFSLEEAIPLAEVQAFFGALRERYLSHLGAARIGMLPSPDAASSREDLLPGREVLKGQWSAFVAPDLAPIFAETPWLDIPPSPEGQADLLSRVQRIRPRDWQAAWALLQAPQASPASPSSSSASAPSAKLGPKAFLLGVMNDETVALALRIEAAKALLPYTDKGSVG
jgi:hypothetical protein